MCLEVVWSNIKTEQWLKEQPGTITAYKVARIRFHGGISSPMFGAHYGKYEKTNVVKKNDRFRDQVAPRIGYNPYYHLFLTQEGAEDFRRVTCDQITLKCEISKESITTMGEQGRYVVIVSKEFTFVEGEKYFNKKEELVCV